MLQLNTLGGFSAFSASDTSLTLPRRRWALLGMIARAGERGVSRDKVLACLWPEVPDDRARGRLQQMLHALRKSVDAQLFLPGDPLRFNPAVVRSDVAEFEAAFHAGEFERAVALYRGPFLDGFHLGDVKEFEEWLEHERGVLSENRASALERLAVGASAHGDHAAAAEWWRAVTAADPLNSRAARRLIDTLVATGDRAEALRHATLHASIVRDELGIEPDAMVMEAIERLSADAHSVSPVARRTSEVGHESSTADVSTSGEMPDGRFTAKPAARPVVEPRWKHLRPSGALVAAIPVLLAAAAWLVVPRLRSALQTRASRSSHSRNGLAMRGSTHSAT